ncbi:MAG: M1 family metallopeptidase [Ignavibacteriaceae bacterium]|nr:M1 family metallopeptidase [Ignavibacteriaceae bacterium]
MKIFIYLLLSSIFFVSYGQSFLPTNFKSAYEKGTRSNDGKPGKNYWQNSADYKIDVEVIPNKRLISGKAQIVYNNNSPDSLNMIVFRLYQNIFQKGALRNFNLNSIDIHDGVSIENLVLNNEIVNDTSKSSYRVQGANLIIFPSNRIAPKSSVKINVDWNFSLPIKSRVRMGAYDSTSFFVAYWYPQVAVYDDLNGWDILPFTGEQEFYNDFNNYEVNIKVPNTIGVWATGELQNVDELLRTDILSKYNAAKKSESVVNIINEEDYKIGNPYNTEGEYNVWKFVAKFVPDFAFATSDHYYWDGCNYESSNKNIKNVFISAVYNKNSKDFYEVAEISKESIDFFEKKSPAYPFPYPAITVYNGDGGMEFPMMVNDGSTNSRASTVGLTSHEIAHTYFPFMMGINEKLYAWMDESWAVMLPFDFQHQNGGKQLQNNVQAYSDFAGHESEVPPIVPSYQLRGRAYRMAAYTRPALSYYFLKDYLGEQKFNDCLHDFMNSWVGKHPSPYDFFYTFNRVAKEDLSWFWKPWLFDYGYPDLAIKNVKNEGNTLSLEIYKKGNIPVPIKLKVITSAEEKTIYETVKVWKDKETHFFKIDLNSELVKIELGDETIPDVDKSNNLYEIKK